MADDTCETCGKTGDPMRVLQDTHFCPECWADFRSGRWEGIGSKLDYTAPGEGKYADRCHIERGKLIAAVPLRAPNESEEPKP